MQITARLEEATLKQILSELLPVTILLDGEQGLEGRWIRIDPAARVDFVAGQGLRLTTGGELRWTLGPVPVRVTLRTMTLLIKPLVSGSETTGRVYFCPVIESADLANVPNLLDRGIVVVVNQALEVVSEHLAWDFSKTLALQFGLPKALLPLESVRAGVKAAKVQVFDDALELTIALGMHVTRHETPPAAAGSAPVGPSAIVR